MSYPLPLEHVRCERGTEHHGHTHHVGPYEAERLVRCPGVVASLVCVCTYGRDTPTLPSPRCGIHGYAATPQAGDD